MAVGNDLLTYPEHSLSPQDFAIMLERATIIKTGILYGCTTTKASSNTVNVSAGWVAVRGRLVKLDSGTLTFSLPASGTVIYYALVKVDLANTEAPCSVYISTGMPADETSDFNYSNGVAYCQLAKITATPLDSTVEAMGIINIGNESAYTLLASGWDASTKIYTITDALITANSDQEYLPSIGITDDQLKALQKANIQDAGQSTGTATLKAYGSVPAIDIPIRIKYRGG